MVREQPGAVAVSFAGRRVTYARLNEEANRIALLLENAGVGAESLVAVYLERSPALIAGLLGVWKAGGAYLPIDPTNPRQRVAATLEDSKVAFVLTEKNLAGSLPDNGAQMLCIDDAPPVTESRGLKQPSLSGVQPLPGQLAYVIY